MHPPGASRGRIARVLRAAYGDGLLSEDTFARRSDELLRSRLIDPARVIGDLNTRTVTAGWHKRLTEAFARRTDERLSGPLLALDWTGGRSELLIGRHDACDIVLADPTVSRQHARLVFRDGAWVLTDLHSTNGTMVNGVTVGRCRLCPGDSLALGDTHLRID